MKLLALILLLWINLPASLHAQSSFSKTFYLADDFGSNAGMNIHPYEDGFQILVGRRTDHDHCGLTKINQLGYPEWSHIYYLENQNTPPDPGRNIVVNGEYTYITTCYNNSGIGRDLQLLCVSNITHDTFWTKTYPYPLDDEAHYLLGGPDSSLVMISNNKKQGPGSRLRVTKTDLWGNIIWDNFFDDYKTYIPGESCITKDGHIMISGNCVPYNEFSERAVLTKMDQSGNKVWQRVYNSTENIGTEPSVMQLDNGGFALGYIRDTFAIGGILYTFPPVVYILDSLGNEVTHRTFPNRWRRDLYRLRPLPNGDILGIGLASGHPDTFSDGGFLFRMTMTGDLLWQRAIKDTRYSDGKFADGIATPDGGILATGFIEEFIGRVSVWVFKIGGNGCYESDCDSEEFYVSAAKETLLPDKSRYRLQPNPASSVFHLVGATGEERQVDIFDQLGRLVLQVNLPQADGIPVEHLPQGYYTVKITLNNHHFTTLKLIKQ